VMARAIGLYVENEMPTPEVIEQKTAEEAAREKLMRNRSKAAVYQQG